MEESQPLLQERSRSHPKSYNLIYVIGLSITAVIAVTIYLTKPAVQYTVPTTVLNPPQQGSIPEFPNLNLSWYNLAQMQSVVDFDIDQIVVTCTGDVKCVVSVDEWDGSGIKMVYVVQSLDLLGVNNLKISQTVKNGRYFFNLQSFKKPTKPMQMLHVNFKLPKDHDLDFDIDGDNGSLYYDSKATGTGMIEARLLQGDVYVRNAISNLFYFNVDSGNLTLQNLVARSSVYARTSAGPINITMEFLNSRYGIVEIQSNAGLISGRVAEYDELLVKSDAGNINLDLVPGFKGGNSDTYIYCDAGVINNRVYGFSGLYDVESVVGGVFVSIFGKIFHKPYGVISGEIANSKSLYKSKISAGPNTVHFYK
ncbi:hypothetical protein HDV06_000280 [Boothiomyces sp. JEL0866]|nr:hypothetical protein HDV06_000280 [Boothiomyces sp. JEL0866]